MFWSIPSNSTEFSVNTPLGTKSIRYLYFENKNNQARNFSETPLCIDIAIDGKKICRNLTPIPFMTCHNGKNIYKWQDVALELNVNVDNSEVKISGTYDNDFNIVFVCSADECDEKGGYDFIESKFLILSKAKATETETPEPPTPSETTHTIYSAEDFYKYVCCSGHPSTPYSELNDSAKTGLEQGYRNWASENPSHIHTVGSQPAAGSQHTQKPVKTYAIQSGGETVVDCDYAPLTTAAFCYTKGTDGLIKNYPLKSKIEIYCDNAIMPEEMDIDFISIKAKIPYNRAKWRFTEKTEKHVTIKYDITNKAEFLADCAEMTIVLCMLFGYKKL